jgi:sarcosine oxidase delta subunit
VTIANRASRKIEFLNGLVHMTYIYIAGPKSADQATETWLQFKQCRTENNGMPSLHWHHGCKYYLVPFSDAVLKSDASAEEKYVDYRRTFSATVNTLISNSRLSACNVVGRTCGRLLN